MAPVKSGFGRLARGFAGRVAAGRRVNLSSADAAFGRAAKRAHEILNERRWLKAHIGSARGHYEYLKRSGKSGNITLRNSAVRSLESAPNIILSHAEMLANLKGVKIQRQLSEFRKKGHAGFPQTINWLEENLLSK